MSDAPARLKYPADWIQRRENGPPISVVTAYDATMARWASASSVDAILVGDSLGMVVQGRRSTMGVTLDEMIYHARLVRRGAPDRFIIADLPFGSFQASIENGVNSAFRMMKEAESDAVKMEGADPDTLEIIRKLTESGVPVMGHLGFTPQSVLQKGGFRVQGRSPDQGESLVNQAQLLEEAGCFGLVLELVVGTVARDITESIAIPTIGIGAGPDTTGQVLVMHDLLGLDSNFHPRFVKRFADLSGAIQSALNAFHQEVQAGTFPDDSHTFRT